MSKKPEEILNVLKGQYHKIEQEEAKLKKMRKDAHDTIRDLIIEEKLFSRVDWKVRNTRLRFDNVELHATRIGKDVSRKDGFTKLSEKHAFTRLSELVRVVYCDVVKFDGAEIVWNTSGGTQSLTLSKIGKQHRKFYKFMHEHNIKVTNLDDVAERMQYVQNEFIKVRNELERKG